MMPSRISGWPKLSVGGSDAEVARQGQLAAAAERVAGDRGDGGPRDASDGVERVAERGADHDGFVLARELGDVGAGREDALAAVTTTAPGGSAANPPATSASWLEQGRGQRVHLGPVELHDRNAVVAPLHGYELIHRSTSSAAV